MSEEGWLFLPACTPCIPASLAAAASYLFTGFACFTRRTSWARETLEVGMGREEEGIRIQKRTKGNPHPSPKPLTA